MPRFYLDVYDGKIVLDGGGADLPSSKEVHLEAIHFAGEVLKTTATRIALGEDRRMEVTDDEGLIRFRRDFSVVEAAVISDGRS